MNPLTKAIDQIDNRDPFGDVSCQHDLEILRRAVRLIERLGSEDDLSEPISDAGHTVLDGLRQEARTLIDDTIPGAVKRALTR